MPRHYQRERRDANHKEIKDHLEAHGVEVVETMRPLDLLICNRDNLCGWIEVKTESRNAAIMLTQVKFMADTKMPVIFAKTKDEALQFAQTLKGLTQKQKDDLAVFYINCTKKQVHPAVIERVLTWNKLT